MDTSSASAKPRGKRKIVSTKPTTTEGLTFTLVPHLDSVSTLKLTNRCNKAVAFKVKTNNTDRYLVQPNQGVIVQGGDAQIQIFCLTRNVNDMLTQSFQQLKKYDANDKFLVQTRTVEANTMKYLLEKTSTPGGMNDVSEQLSQLFAKTPENKQKIVSLKYSVNFDSQYWMQPVTSTSTADKSADNEGALSKDEVQDEASSANVETPESSQANTKSEDVPSSSKAIKEDKDSKEETEAMVNDVVAKDSNKMVDHEDNNTDASNTQTVENPAPANIKHSATPNYDFEKIEKDMSTLRKKYDELLKWTLQLTGERDQLQKLTNKLTQENTKLRLVADMKREETMNVTKDLIKKENESSATKLNDDALAEKFKQREASAARSSGYSMFTILAVAVLSFFVSRIVVLYQNNPKALSRVTETLTSSKN